MARNGWVRSKLSSPAQAHCGIDPKIRRRGWIQRMQHLNQGAVRIGDDDPDAGAGAAGQRLGHQHRACSRPIQFGCVSSGDREGERVWTGPVQWSYRPDMDRPIAKQAATDQIGDRLRGEAPDCHDSAACFELLNHPLGQIDALIRCHDAVVG